MTYSVPMSKATQSGSRCYIQVLGRLSAAEERATSARIFCNKGGKTMTAYETLLYKSLTLDKISAAKQAAREDCAKGEQRIATMVRVMEKLPDIFTQVYRDAYCEAILAYRALNG